MSGEQRNNQTLFEARFSGKNETGATYSGRPRLNTKQSV